MNVIRFKQIVEDAIVELSGNKHFTDSTNEMKQSISDIIEISLDTVFESDKTYDSKETIYEKKTESEVFKNSDSIYVNCNKK